MNAVLLLLLLVHPGKPTFFCADTAIIVVVAAAGVEGVLPQVAQQLFMTFDGTTSNQCSFFCSQFFRGFFLTETRRCLLLFVVHVFLFLLSLRNRWQLVLYNRLFYSTDKRKVFASAYFYVLKCLCHIYEQYHTYLCPETTLLF